MQTRHGHIITTAARLLIVAASREEKTTMTLYRILLRLAAAWLAVAGVGIVIAGAAFGARVLDVAGLLGLVAFAPACLTYVVAWILKPAR